MTKLSTERRRICVEPETSPVSFITAGSTAYSIVEKIKGLLEKLWANITGHGFAEKSDLEPLAKSEDVFGKIDEAKGSVLDKMAEDKVEILDAISHIDPYYEYTENDLDEIFEPINTEDRNE